MCLGIPGRITEAWTEASVPMAHADFAGTARTICLAYLPGAGAGDYVITHMGYALTQISEEDARQTLEIMREHKVLPS
jgi:hydrogenase expression/formation protein HypC